MVSRKNFQPNGRQTHQQRLRGVALQSKKLFKPPGVIPPGNGFHPPLFTASQIPDNPGYMDFNNPTPPPAAVAFVPPLGEVASTVGVAQQLKRNKGKPKKKPIQSNLHQPPVPPNQRHFPPNGAGGNWNKNQHLGGPPNPRSFHGLPPRGPIFNHLRGGRRMVPHGGGMGLGPRGPPMPLMPPPQPHAFQPKYPHIPPMGRGPMPPMGGPPPQFMRRNGRAGPPPPIPPPMMPPPPRMPLSVPPIPYNGLCKMKPNGKILKKIVKPKNSSIKTLRNLINQYPVDKPWVNDEIRAEHEKKVDIENRLNGKKDDELFAQFKVQRDKFVGMYEAARAEYLKKEAATVKAKEAKDKQEIENTTSDKDGSSKEAISTN